jgi:hypothetical protein
MGTWRTWVRLTIIVISLALSAMAVIKAVVRDTVDEVNRVAGFENIPANPIDIEDSQSLYREENFDAALSALEEHAGHDPALLSVGVLPYLAEFQIKDGQRAKGYRYYAKNGEMAAFNVKLVGSGSIEGSQFPYETIGAGVTQKLAASVTKRDPSLSVTNMTIERGLVEGELAWSVNAESDERTGVVFQADPDGSGLADATTRAPERGCAGSAPTTNEAPSQTDCLPRASGDAVKIQPSIQ